MDLCSDVATPAPATAVRSCDDRSDSGLSSGLSSLRGGWTSGEERCRSVSRSSGLSGLSGADDPLPSAVAATTATTATVAGASDAAKAQPSAASAAAAAPGPPEAAAPPDSAVRVWRDPAAYGHVNVHHVDSVQHQSLLMAHPGQVMAVPTSSPAAAFAAHTHPALHPHADLLLKQRAYPAHQFSPLPLDQAYRRDVEKRGREQEERQQKLNAEEAVHQHFEESLRLMQKQQQQQQQQHMQQQQRLREQQQSDRDRCFYPVTTQANRCRPQLRTPPTLVTKESPPAARLPKMEPNFFPSGFSAANMTYTDAPYVKVKQETLAVSSKSPISDLSLSTPLSLLSDAKSSVIVKNDTKISMAASDLQSQAQPKSQVTPQSLHLPQAQPLQHHNSLSHSTRPPSPKFAHAHYQSGVPVGSKYEYRGSPQTVLPHISASYVEPQNLAGLSKMVNVPHHRTLPLPEHRYPPKTTSFSYQQYPLQSVAPSKPKVSSPAPPHMYGEPSAGIASGTPMGRTADNIASVPLPLTSKAPTSFQPVPHRPSPPPAHSTRTLATANTVGSPSSGTVGPPVAANMYYASAAIRPPQLSRASPLSLTSLHPSGVTSVPSALPPSLQAHPAQLRPHLGSGLNLASQAFQTQPLDLGMSASDRSLSPKRKVSPYSGPLPLDKKPRNDSGLVIQNQPVLSCVSEPSPLIANAATTITTVANSAYCLATASPASMTAPATGRTASGDGSVRPNSAGSINAGAGVGAGGGPSGGPGGGSPTAGSPLLPPVPSPAHLSVRTPSPGRLPSPAALPAAAAPVATPTPTPTTTPTPTPTPTPIATTPVKAEPSAEEKPSSPVVRKTSYPVHKLKKAWLQRHSGEDGTEDASYVIGYSVTLPVRIDSPTAGAPFSSPSLVPPSLPSSHSVANEPPKTATPAPSSVSTTARDTSSPTSNTTTTGLTTPRKAASVTLNGHAGKLDSDDTSSSESEVKSTSTKRKPKVNRKKGAAAATGAAGAASPASGTATSIRTGNDEPRRKRTQTATQSESISESERESGSDKESDNGVSNKKTANGGSSATGKEARKRGRKPKPSKQKEADEEPRSKKAKDKPAPPHDPFQKPPITQLKKTGENFLQDGACFEVAPKLAKCRECRWTPNQRSKNMPNIFCRFYAFRRLRYTKNGQLAIAGFSHPNRDASEDDLKLWLPLSDSPPSDLDVETSTFLLSQVGDQFCDLLAQEKEALEHHMGTNKVVAWKRVVQGVREMCDVCETTLFNFHWACSKCGFVVCLDCYKSRRDGTAKTCRTDGGRDRDENSWLLCTNRQPHEQEKLMITQIVAGDSLDKVSVRVHRLRGTYNIPQACGCPLSLSKTTNGLAKGSLTGSESEDDKDANFSTLRELLIRPAHKSNGGRASPSDEADSEQAPQPSLKGPKRSLPELDESKSSGCGSVDGGGGGGGSGAAKEAGELKHFVRKYMRGYPSRREAPLSRVMTLSESQTLYADVPHSWLCDGKLLKLTDAKNPANYRIFQDQWKRGQPVIVSDVSKSLDTDLWTPTSFIRDFGDEKNDLINCTTGSVLSSQSMRKFWEGFECVSKRLRDDNGTSMLLKLKDWPPGEDFAELMPARFGDLMQALPLSEYTRRSGRLNLASRLPECFVKPDLGPKMYIAYGSSALLPNKGTTNLHMDISDAVNVMVYVGVPRDGNNGEDVKEAFRAIDEAGCDILTRRRVREKDELPGALWHIYSAQDADKIRDLLNKVALERGEVLEPHHDPIHDQSWYLDGPLRERLYREYHVEGYTIVQCLGDAIFIPAGAPHQVRNLHNCIKVAEDFVSPENISHCFHLMQEFRELSHQHTNHEDKLQIKNIIYHAVKDALSVLSHAVGLNEDDQDEDEEDTESVREHTRTAASASSAGGSDAKRISPRNGNSSVKTAPDT